MALKNLTLLFVLYGGPGIAALLFLTLGFAMARTRAEVIFTAVIAGALVAVQAAELYYLWGLRLALGGDGDDPLVMAGTAIALAAAALTAVFVVRRLKPRTFR
jgi:xanthine/uracil permease